MMLNVLYTHRATVLYLVFFTVISVEYCYVYWVVDAKTSEDAWLVTNTYVWLLAMQEQVMETFLSNNQRDSSLRLIFSIISFHTATLCC